MTSILCLSAVIVAGTVVVPICSRYERPGSSGSLAHPDEMGGELIGDFGPAGRADQHIAARDVDVVGQRQRHRIARLGRCQVAVIGHDLA